MAAFDNLRERATAIGAWTAIGALALAPAAPLIGGFISQHFHWGWIFFINVPVGVITLALALATVTESRDTSAVRRLDLPGLVTSALMLFALTYALIEGHDRGWTSGLILGSFAVSAVAAGLFALAESRSAAPMVNLSLFRSRVFSGGTVTMMLWAFGVFGIYFFTSLYLQNILGFSPTKAGLAFVPMAVLLIASASIAPPIAARLRPHRTVALGMLIMAVGLALFGRLGAGASFASLMPGFLLFGAGAGPDAGAADQRRAARHAAGPVGGGRRAAERLPRGGRAARHHAHRGRAAVPPGRRPAPRPRRVCLRSWPAITRAWPSPWPWSRSASSSAT